MVLFYPQKNKLTNTNISIIEIMKSRSVMKLLRIMKSRSVIIQFQNMLIIPKLSYHHSIFPIGFKIPLIIEQKYLIKPNINYENSPSYIEPNIHGIAMPNFKYNVLPLIHFKDNEFKEWSLYLQQNVYITYRRQFVVCFKLGNLYGCKYLISFLLKLTKFSVLGSCFIKAARNGCISTMKYMRSLFKYIINHDDVLEWSSINGDIDTLRYFVSKGIDITNIENCALYYASCNGHLDVVRYLVSLGANITCGDTEELCMAASNGHLDVVRYLVSLGANITYGDNDALFMAATNGHLDVVRYLVSLLCTDITYDHTDALYMASCSGYLDIVRYLVSIGANLTAVCNEALFMASANGHFDIVRYLVTQGTDVTFMKNQAVCRALDNGHLEIVQYLISHGAVLPKK